MRITRDTADQVLASLDSSREGLAPAAAAERLATFGPNRIEAIERSPLALRFARQFTHFFALILWAAAALAFLSEQHAPGQGMAALGAAILGVIVVNGAFSFWQEYRAERAIHALQRLLPHEVTAIRGGTAQRLTTEALVPGDVLLVEEGERVPADCRLIEAHGLRANLATVTGEALPQGRSAAPATEDSPLAARNVLLAGTSVVAGTARAVVYATGMRTEFGRIARLAQAADTVRTPLQKEIARLSRLVAALAAALGLAFFAAGQFAGVGYAASFIFAIGIIVANVPEGLLPTVTLALAMATQRMAARRALVRHLPAVETLGAATVIVTDKTGTLTENSMRVRTIVGGTARFHEVARHCHGMHDARQGARRVRLGEPMEIALLDMAARAGHGEPTLARLDELPFDTERRRMSTLHRAPEGRILFCKGAPEGVLSLCTRMDAPEGAGPPVGLDEPQRERLRREARTIAARGERVLALAWRMVPEQQPREQWEQDLVLAGLVGFEDPVRAEVPGALRKCREAGIRVVMVTGDHPDTALAVARATGLVRGPEPRVHAGEELERLSDGELALALAARETVFARASADQKLRIVQTLQRAGHVVAATGDGVNDAPALRRADVGIAMGLRGTDVARESSGIVLLDDNFASIVAAIEEGRAVYDNIRKFLTYILSSNVPEMVPYLAFVLAHIPLPLTVIQILAVDLGTDMLPALALGAEPPAPGVMQRPPRARGERLLSWPLLARAYLWLGALEAAAAMGAYFFVLERGGWYFGEPLAATEPLYLQATTACLAAIVVMQVVNLFVCRDPERSAFAFAARRNHLLPAAIAIELALLAAIVYTPAGQAIFGTAALAGEVWLMLLPLAIVMLLLEEARKLARRAYAARRGNA